MTRRAAGVVTVGALVAAFVAVQVTGGGGSPLGPAQAAADDHLQAYASCDALLSAYRAQLQRTAGPYGWGGGYGAGEETLASSADSAASAAAPAAPTAGAVGSDDTGTNVQEAGVDEPDVAKVATGRLVTVTGGSLAVVTAGAQPRLLGRLALGEQAYGAELLLDGDRALVIEPGTGIGMGRPEPAVAEAGPALPPESGSGSAPASSAPASSAPGGPSGGDPVAVPPSGIVTPASPVAPPSAATPPEPVPTLLPALPPLPIVPSPPGSDVSRTTLRLADLSDPAHPRWMQSWTVDGSYVSARLIAGTVRLVTTSHPTPVASSPKSDSTAAQLVATLANRAAAGRLSADQVLPVATLAGADGAVIRQGPAVDCKDVSFAEGAEVGDLTLVTTLRPQGSLAPLGSVGIAAPGDLVYAAADRLVVATSRWTGGGAETTQLHTFDTSDPAATVRYLASGSLPGQVLGRWAFSWQAGVLRVATTRSGEVATESSGGSASSSGVAPGAVAVPAPDGSVSSSVTAPSPGNGSESAVTTLRENGRDLVTVGTVGGLGKGEQIKAVRYLDDLAIVVTFRQTDPLYVLDLADAAHPRVRGELMVTGFSSYLHPIGDHRLLGIGMAADAKTGRTTGLQASVFDLADPAAPALTSRIALGAGYTPVSDESRAFTYDPARGLALLPVQSADQTRSAGVPAAVGLTVSPSGAVSQSGRLALPDLPSRVLLSGDVVLAVGSQSVVAATADGLARTGAVAI